MPLNHLALRKEEQKEDEAERTSLSQHKGWEIHRMYVDIKSALVPPSLHPSVTCLLTYMFCDVTEPKRSRAAEPLGPAQGGAEGRRSGAHQSVAAQEVVNSSLGNLHS